MWLKRKKKARSCVSVVGKSFAVCMDVQILALGRYPEVEMRYIKQ